MLFRVQDRAKVWLIFAFSVLALLLFLTFATLGARLFPEWYGLVGGLVLTAIAFVCYLGGEKAPFLYLLTFLLNTAGSGFCASAYYRMAELPCTTEALFPAVLLPFLLLFLCGVALSTFPDTKEPIIAVAIALELALLIASIVFWVIRDGEFYAFSLFSHLIALFYTVVFALTVNEEERAAERDVAIGSFGAFMLVGVAALLAVLAVAGGDGGDCDCCECFDCCDCDDFRHDTKKKRKNSHKTV